MGSLKSTFPVLVAILAIIWIRREPKFDWKPAPALSNYASCRKNSKEIHLLFGGTSMLGSYIVKVWKENYPEVCVMNYNRKPCKECDISITGDLRDTRHIERLFAHYNSKSSKQHITTVILSIKPELEGTNWRTFIEINYSALVEIMKIAEKNSAYTKSVIYVSSIAASSHYIEHHNANESFPQPLLTEYEAPYDLSKRLAEDYILDKSKNKKGEFNTIALRVSGIIGGVGDPYFHHRAFPFLMSFDNPIIVDYGFAGNIALALKEMNDGMQAKPQDISGQFYYYTGEHILENITAVALSEYTGKPVFKIPAFLLNYFLSFWQWFRWDHNTYTLIDLLRCANVEQTFDNSKFIKTFKNFKPKHTILEALEYLYAPKK